MFGVDDLASEVTIPGQSTYRVARLRPPPTQGVIYTCTRPVSPTTNTKVSMIAFFSPTFWSISYDLVPVNCRHTIQVRITVLESGFNASCQALVPYHVAGVRLGQFEVVGEL